MWVTMSRFVYDISGIAGKELYCDTYFGDVKPLIYPFSFIMIGGFLVGLVIRIAYFIT